MFLKNSFPFVFLTLWIFMSSVNPFSVEKRNATILEIPKLNYQESVKIKNNVYLFLKEDLATLETNDKFIIRKGNETFYYKVITKYKKDKREVLPILEEGRISLIEENANMLQTIIIAINTGKLVKNE